MFKPDSELAHMSSHISWLFHCTIGLDPLGNFSAVEQLSYEVEPFEYAEMGRNHSPVVLPFQGPGKPGELTMRWGMIIRSKLYEWIHDVECGRDYFRHVYIFQLSRKHLPLRIYHLTGAWPVSWTVSEFTTEDKTGMATEQVTLRYDQIDMANLSAVAILGDLMDEPLAELAAALRPPSTQSRQAAHERKPWTAEERGKVDDSLSLVETEDQRQARWEKLREKWLKNRRSDGSHRNLKAWTKTEGAEETGSSRRELKAWEKTKGTAKLGSSRRELEEWEATEADEERIGTKGREEEE